MNFSGTWARVIGAAVCVACSGAAVAEPGEPGLFGPGRHEDNSVEAIAIEAGD